MIAHSVQVKNKCLTVQLKLYPFAVGFAYRFEDTRIRIRVCAKSFDPRAWLGVKRPAFQHRCKCVLMWNNRCSARQQAGKNTRFFFGYPGN